MFLDDVDLALVLFDQSNREKPLNSVGFWIKQLSRGRNRPRRIILIASRIDRGFPTLTEGEILEYCKSNSIGGGYVATSSLTGEGLDKLMQKIKEQIFWDELPATITTLTFKRVKEYVLELKAAAKKNILVTPENLYKSIQKVDTEWQFSRSEMMTAIRHLGNHGYINILSDSSGEESILL